MLLTVIYAALSTAATALIYWGCPTLSLWWLLPIWLGLFLALGIAYVLFWVVFFLIVPSNPHAEWLKRLQTWNITRVFRWFFLLCGTRCPLHNAEAMPDGGFLLVSNHRTALDPFAMLAALDGPHLRYVAKEEIFRVPVVGPLLSRIFFLSIDRKNPRNAVTSIKKAAEYISDNGMSVGIFPEGTRSKDGTLLPFHAGSFKIAKMAGCPVVVTGLKVDRRKGRMPACYEMQVLAVIPAEEVATATTNELCARAESLIREHLGQ